MTVEEDLRETLQERAARVSPSPDGWTSITVKIDHRRQRARVVVLAVAALLPVAAVGATVAAVRDGNGARPVDTAGPGLTPSTPDTTVLATPPPGGPTTTAMRVSTTVARKPAAPAVTLPRTVRVWPETQAELDEIQNTFDQGHQPWRGSPADVARAFLADRGLTEVQVSLEGTGAGPMQVAVPYVADGVGGTVSLARTGAGDVYYVAAHTTDRISQVEVSRADDGLVLSIESPVAGTVTARTKRPGGSWSDTTRQPTQPGGRSRMQVAVGQAGDLILQLRHEGADHKVGVADQYVAVKVSGPTPPVDALGTGSTLRVDGLGPVKVGMSLGEAEGAAGVPMTRRFAGSCTSLTPDRGPAGVAFVSTGGKDLVDLVTVAEPGVMTVSGIGIGSTLAEVDKAYPSAERRLTNNEGRLVVRAEDPSLADFELVVGIGEGKVTQLWAGHKGIGLQDEICF